MKDEPACHASYLAACRAWTLDEIDRIIPTDATLGPVLYDLMRNYPLREAKALRPALAIATARALGGTLEGILPTAAALELYHNAFLIHDDVEDGSLLRRDAPTLHRTYGVPVAVNVGDAMLAIALRPLLGNTRTLGLGPALRILDLVARMAWESAEGQAIELDWIRRSAWDLGPEDYLRMVHKKTTWYTFLAPVEAGAIAAEADEEVRASLRAFAEELGAAFQIRDDVLNLAGVEGRVGKEHAGDLWEGKRTLPLLHALASCRSDERDRAVEILARPRPDASSPHARGRTKSARDVAFLLSLIRRTGGVAHAQQIAVQKATRALTALDVLGERLPPSTHRDFMVSLVEFVVERDR